MSGLSSALSKLGIGKHRKSKSTSSTQFNPSSPRQSADGSRNVSSSRTRQSIDQTRVAASPRIPMRPVVAGEGNPTAASPSEGDRDSVVVIGRDGNEVSGYDGGGRDSTGHLAPFVDERNRPDLPTTISNVNNPVPESSTSNHSKPLPSVPTGSAAAGNSPPDFTTPSQSGLSGESRYTSSVPANPPRLPEIPKTQPLHHLTSVDRDNIFRDQHERPKPAVTESEILPAEEEEAIGGRRFGHVGSANETASSSGASPMKKDHRVVGGLETLGGDKTQGAGTSTSSIEIPERKVSKRQSELVDQPVGTRVNTDGRFSRPASGVLSPRQELISSRDPDIDEEKYLDSRLANISPHPHPARATASAPLSQHNLVAGPELDEQRHQLVNDIVADAKDRLGGQQDVGQLGRGVFEAAGMGDLLDQKNSVDVHTKWLEPVVQEHVRLKEHTEIETFIDRDIHKYHVYPKIQPISDPNPIQLQPRHRIFSQADGQWHEVVGDQAAIEILGEEAFYNGKKEVREVRGKALPGFGEISNMTSEERRDNGLEEGAVGGGRVIQREGILGGKMGEWKEIGRSGTFLGSAGRGGSLNNGSGEVGEEGGEKTVGMAF